MFIQLTLSECCTHHPENLKTAACPPASTLSKMASNRDTKDTKSDVVLEEYAAGTKDGVEGVLTERDNFGARKKVDPVEIKLVRKIDMYMMVSQNMWNS